MSELVEYYIDIDKRLAWENNYYEQLEQCRAYPLKTSMYYGKLQKKASDTLFLSHNVEIKGNRQYLTCCSVEHSEYPLQKKVQRATCAMSSNYFEPTADGKGVKNIFIFQTLQGSNSDGLS